MKINKYTDLVSLIANIGVLIGVVFLVVEIRLANQIATRDSRDDLVDSYIQNIAYSLENPELAALRVKLRSHSPELTDLEKEQAHLMAHAQVYFWAKVHVGADSGLLPQQNEDGYVVLARNFIKSYPGLASFIEQALLASGSTDELVRQLGSGIYIAIWEEVEAVKSRNP